MNKTLDYSYVIEGLDWYPDKLILYLTKINIRNTTKQKYTKVNHINYLIITKSAHLSIIYISGHHLKHINSSAISEFDCVDSN